MDGQRRDLLMPLATSVVAGAIGVWALDRVTWWMWRRQDPATLAQEKAVRPLGLDPAHVVAHRAKQSLGSTDPPARQPTALGLAVHYAIGIAPAALYGLTGRRGVARGTGYGIALFLLQDVVGNWLLRTSAPPNAYPRQAYVRGLVGHAVYGAATDGALRALEAVR